MKKHCPAIALLLILFISSAIGQSAYVTVLSNGTSSPPAAVSGGTFSNVTFTGSSTIPTASTATNAPASGFTFPGSVDNMTIKTNDGSVGSPSFLGEQLINSREADVLWLVGDSDGSGSLNFLGNTANLSSFNFSYILVYGDTNSNMDFRGRISASCPSNAISGIFTGNSSLTNSSGTNPPTLSQTLISYMQATQAIAGVPLPAANLYGNLPAATTLNGYPIATNHLGLLTFMGGLSPANIAAPAYASFESISSTGGALSNSLVQQTITHSGSMTNFYYTIFAATNINSGTNSGLYFFTNAIGGTPTVVNLCLPLVSAGTAFMQSSNLTYSFPVFAGEMIQSCVSNNTTINSVAIKWNCQELITVP